MMPTHPAAVLFDLDGTLVDSAHDLGAAADSLRTARGLPSLPMTDYRPAAGAGARGLLGIAFDMAPDHADFPSLREEFFTAYERRLTDCTAPFEGVPELLWALQQQGIPWGIVTNKSRRFAAPLVAAFPALAGLGVLVCGDTTPYSKPHPAPLSEAARVLNVPPEDCWYVGDDLRDMQAAAAAGMVGIAAAYGYVASSEQLQHWNAQKQIDRPLDLLKLLGMA